eukprot:gene34631-biopygen34656
MVEMRATRLAVDTIASGRGGHGSPSAQADLMTYSTLISACEKGAQCDHALRLLGHMRAQQISPDTFTYNCIISVCAKVMRWEEALEQFDEMVAEGIQGDLHTYNAALNACEKGAGWERAEQVSGGDSLQGRLDAGMAAALRFALQSLSADS